MAEWWLAGWGMTNQTPGSQGVVWRSIVHVCLEKRGIHNWEEKEKVRQRESQDVKRYLQFFELQSSWPMLFSCSTKRAGNILEETQTLMVLLMELKIPSFTSTLLVKISGKMTRKRLLQGAIAEVCGDPGSRITEQKDHGLSDLFSFFNT